MDMSQHKGFGLPVGVLFTQPQIPHSLETDQQLHSAFMHKGLH